MGQYANEREKREKQWMQQQQQRLDTKHHDRIKSHKIAKETSHVSVTDDNATIMSFLAIVTITVGICAIVMYRRSTSTNTK